MKQILNWLVFLTNNKKKTILPNELCSINCNVFPSCYLLLLGCYFQSTIRNTWCVIKFARIFNYSEKTLVFLFLVGFLAINISLIFREATSSGTRHLLFWSWWRIFAVRKIVNCAERVYEPEKLVYFNVFRWYSNFPLFMICFSFVKLCW